MKSCNFIIVGCIILFSISTAKSQEAEKQNDTQYKLVWSDEFEKDGRPDSSNWIYENGFVRNKELQWYQPQNAFCKNGFLIIEGKRERVRNNNFLARSDNWRKNREFAEYTSSSLLTRELHSWQFGRFVMRSKIETNEGLWPAFWTLGVSGPWPHNGEIDIMEYYNNTILANFAWGGEKKGQPIWDDNRVSVDELKEKDANWDENFHVWRMDWDRQSIKLFLDDVLLNSVELTETFNKDKDAKNPFLQPHYIIVNLAIGGNNGGDPSQTKFPSRYVIDYIRVFQK